jgi:hypothetical protein
MSNQLKIETNSEGIGSITFNEPEETLAEGRTASGFRLRLPTTVNLNRPANSNLEVLLQDVRVVFRASGLEFGVARCDNLQTPMGRDTPIFFSWDWALSVLGLYEKLRSGKPPRFNALLHGNLHYKVPGTNFRDECPSVPYPFNSNGEIKYSRDTWTGTLRKLNILDSVLVEIPFPSDPPSDWDEMFESLRDAREALDKGGSSGWKGCAMAVRSAFEKWSKKEKENQGPGWPSQIDIKEFHQRTKEQRADAIRWHVYQLAHYFAHNNARECNREDATLVLAVLSALLDVRKP